MKLVPSAWCFMCWSTHRLNNIRTGPFREFITVIRLVGLYMLLMLCCRRTVFCALSVHSVSKCGEVYLNGYS